MAKRMGSEGRGARLCRREGCERTVGAGEAYCRGHGRTPEAVAFRRELKGAASYLELGAGALGSVKGADAFERFGLRARRGEFDRVLEARHRRALEQAAAAERVAREIAVARLRMVRALTEERDPSRLATTLVRLTKEVGRAARAKD